MFVKHGRSRLVTVAILLVVLVGNIPPEVTASPATNVVNQLNSLQDYLKELEYIEQEEELQDVFAKDKVGVGKETIEKTCDLIVKEEIKVKGNEVFSELVDADLTNWDDCYRRWNAKLAEAQWNFETDMKQETEDLLTDVTVGYSNWVKKLARNAQRYVDHSNYKTLSDDVKRKLRLMAFVTQPKEESKAEELVKVQARLQNDYSKATVKGKKLEPDLTKTMAESRDGDDLLDAWLGWRDATGPNMRQDYSTMVDLLNQGAVDNGFTDYAQAWMESQFDGTDNLEDITERLWLEIRPLYEQLHAYMRNKLSKQYPQYTHIFNDGGIPAHLSGNMWAQEWGNIYDIVKPYPEIDEANIDNEMKKQNYTVDTMFNMAEGFYKSIGLYSMSREFQTRSMKVRPPGDRDVVCHAAAFDFFSGKKDNDFRIKMCTEVNMEYLETIHHEMGHIEYFMAYKDQPAVYRTGANSAFHEAIGDTIALSVMSHEHLTTVGLINTDKRYGNMPKELAPYARMIENLEDEMGEINFLLHRALFKIAFLPFGYMIDKWRWEVFRGNITEVDYNQRWWDMRLKYQGIVAPVTRSENDFDPGAKFHIPSNSPYICYFVSFIVQFQFYEAMCNASGHTGPLHKCDFYHSTEAGEKLKDMLKLGMSKPWPEAMEKLTGSRDISTDSIKRYFSKLDRWLKDVNENTDVGWDNAKINWKGHD